MGEIWKSPEDASKHRQKKDYRAVGGHLAPGGFLNGMLYEKIFSVGWKGTVFEVRMDKKTAEELLAITQLAYSAFPPRPPASTA